MKFVFIGITLFLLSSCASTSDLNNIEQLAEADRKTVASLDNKIEHLEADRLALSKQLSTLDGDGKFLKSEALALREKIVIVKKSIDSYKNQIRVLTSNTSKNTKNINAVKTQQNTQHQATALLAKENKALRDQTLDEIKALELEYAEKRRRLKESQSDDSRDQDKGDDDGR
ncbi:MAG: hypothetical protein COA74_08000 [Gammaproteobacteria bacterium]|nr:MAG: hypothetical protein COA74_08000 [Gammaproteobacteria bacterium]